MVFQYPLPGERRTMRRLLPNARSFLVRFGQTSALLGAACLAMAAAPAAMTGAEAAEAEAEAEAATPAAPPVHAVAQPPAPRLRMVRFVKPVLEYPINSRFGLRRLAGEARARRHAGVDIAAPTGARVLASAEGVVTAAGRNGGYGNFVEILHPNGLRTFYAHLSRIETRVGTEVFAGQTVGRVGSTGYSTGPHLHFEVRRDGVPIDPLEFIGREFAVEVEDGRSQA